MCQSRYQKETPLNLYRYASVTNATYALSGQWQRMNKMHIKGYRRPGLYAISYCYKSDCQYVTGMMEMSRRVGKWFARNPIHVRRCLQHGSDACAALMLSDLVLHEKKTPLPSVCPAIHTSTHARKGVAV